MLLTMKMIKLMDFNNFLRLKCIFFFWSKADDLTNKPTPKNQVLKFGLLGGKYGIPSARNM